MRRSITMIVENIYHMSSVRRSTLADAVVIVVIRGLAQLH